MLMPSWWSSLALFHRPTLAIDLLRVIFLYRIDLFARAHNIGNNFACTVQVGGMGLGDDLMSALAMVMPILRSVERLVAFDNRMTDFSLFRVVLAVQGMPSLTHLGKGQPPHSRSAGGHHHRGLYSYCWCLGRLCLLSFVTNRS